MSRANSNKTEAHNNNSPPRMATINIRIIKVNQIVGIAVLTAARMMYLSGMFGCQAGVGIN
jgi:hypothetical protein